MDMNQKQNGTIIGGLLFVICWLVLLTMLVTGAYTTAVDGAAIALLILFGLLGLVGMIVSWFA